MSCTLSPERQIAAAEALELIAAQNEDELTDDEIAGIRRAQAAVQRGEFASERRVQALFGRFRS